MHNPLKPTDSAKQSAIDALRRLPAEVQPPYHWQEFRRRARLRLGETTHTNWRYAAVAAALVLIMCGVAIWGRLGNGGRQLSVNAGTEGVAHGTSAPGGLVGDIDALREVQGWSDLPGASVETGNASHDVALAVNRSHAIESWLATLPREPVVVRVGTRTDVARLEDRIAQVDDLLTSERLERKRPDTLVALQRERTRLVGSLAQVRYAEVLAAASQ